jgi:precorrin-6B methylase 1
VAHQISIKISIQIARDQSTQIVFTPSKERKVCITSGCKITSSGKIAHSYKITSSCKITSTCKIISSHQTATSRTGEKTKEAAHTSYHVE